MSKLQTRLIHNLETNNRIALELVKISSALTKMAQGPSPNVFAKDAILGVASHADNLSKQVTADNEATVALLDTFP